MVIYLYIMNEKVRLRTIKGALIFSALLSIIVLYLFLSKVSQVKIHKRDLT